MGGTLGRDEGATLGALVGSTDGLFDRNSGGISLGSTDGL